MTDTSKSTEQVHHADFSSNSHHNNNNHSHNNHNEHSKNGEHESRDQHDPYHQHRSAHREFHWVEGRHQGSPYANFLETTLDISAGIHACLQIAYASDLERSANRDADPGQTAAPAVGIVESDQLVRLSMAASSLLRDEARRRVDVLND